MPDLLLDERLRRRDDIISAPIDDGYVMLDADAGKYLQFNPVAAHIWDLLEQPRTARDIVFALQSQFDVDAEQCVVDTCGTLEQLLALGVVRRLE
ncbi:MAG: PqqD family protein [bacterium]